MVIETTEILDQAKMMASLAKEPELMMFTDGTTLMSLLSPEDQKALEDGLAERGISLASVAKMKPWMLSAMVALPACELARKAGGAPVLDVKLAEDAKAAGKKLEGLETVADQLHAMASLPMEFHLKGLIDTLKLGDRMDDVIETMIVLYTRATPARSGRCFAPCCRDEEGQGGLRGVRAGDDRRAQQDDDQERRADPRGGNAFIAVGALHLPGPDGLIELLRKAGYTVTAVTEHVLFTQSVICDVHAKRDFVAARFIC